MATSGLSYREVMPDFSQQDGWIEVILNTGGTQSTLQDIKVAEKAGGYCFQNVQLNHNRNRYIFWRTYQDILELTEISLDFTIYQNNVRYKFTDSPIINVSIFEAERFVTVLVTTVSSIHRINFPHPDVLADGSSTATSSSASGSVSGASSAGASVDFNDSQSFSIFRDANVNAARDPKTFFIIEAQGGAAACSYLSAEGDAFQAYFALASQNHLSLYIMNCETGNTVVHQLKEQYTMPRLFSNIKGALIGRSDNTDAEHATSLFFTLIHEEIYLLALYRNDHLRIWSANTLQSICSINCVRDGFENRMQGPQNNALRRINERSVCVFLSHSSGSEFICIDIEVDELPSNGNAHKLSLARRKVIAAPQLDLADFDVCDTHIWALWSNAEGEFSISNFSLESSSSHNWVSAAMEPPPDRFCVAVEQGMDPREAYCSYIFHPGKFERSVITKALFMFRRSNVRSNMHCNMTLLKEHVCQAIDEEIKHEMKEYDVSDEEYLEIATRQWERFYSCCEQYHIKACQPTGLVILESLDAVCVVKKNSSSLLRPCEILEHLMLTGNNVDNRCLLPLHFPGNEIVGEQVTNLVAILAQIEQWLPEEVKIDLDKRFYQLEMPSIIISRLSDEILAGSDNREIFPNDFLIVLRQKLQSIKDLRGAIAMLMDFLRQPDGTAQKSHTNLNHSTRFLMSIGILFGSHAGVSLLSETVRQIASIRFAMCRNLLILLQLLIDKNFLPMNVLETLRTEFMPNLYVFLQSYYVMVWISETPVNMSTATALESSMQRLHLLQLTNGSGRIFSNGGKCQSMPLLRVFLNAKGLYSTLTTYADQNKIFEEVTWLNTLLPLSAIVCQIIWPVSANFVFGEWLFGTCQHIVIEDYVRLLNDWCEWNICSRNFMLAVSLLDSGESDKAYDLFIQTARGVIKEPFLMERIIKDTALSQRIECLNQQSLYMDDDDVVAHETIYNQSIAQFYLKVIQLFEQHNALDHIIAMAQVAIGLLPKNDAQLPMFQSIVFNNHLQLEHYEEAYHSLIYNSELSRRKDCLRQLVITLFNRKRLDLLMRFPYVGLYEEFENIVESRARSQLIENNEIYEFLYAFHVNNGNMRKASAVMYEQAMRLQLECETLESMQKRCDVLLVCINALHLIDLRYRWIAKPVISDEYVVNPLSGQKRKADNAEEMAQEQPHVVVLEIKDIRREHLHTEALVHLAQHRKDIQTFLHADAQELTMILASCGLFTAALKLAKGFEISLLPLFDSLTAACARTADESTNEAWSWLQENDLADLPHRNKAADMAWALWQKLLLENEAENSTEIRKSVVNKLLSLNVFVPQWLINDYKLANCPELLRLFVKHNRLLEAADLGIEMLNAMLGCGSEYFSFKYAIAVTNPLMCLPLNTLDLLLYGLKLNSKDNIEYEEAYINLEDVLLKYIETATHTAESKIQMAHQQNQREQQFIQ